MAITSLTKRLVGEGTRQDMEYEEELVHNGQVIAWNAIEDNAKKVEDNVLHVMIATVILPQPTMLQDPASNPFSALLKAPNALIIIGTYAYGQA